MTHLLRGKQAGIQGDFSAGIIPENLKLDIIYRYGINSQISATAYDPVQSLLALGTAETKFGPGQIHVFGQKRVAAVLSLPKGSRSTIKSLYFCADKLVALSAHNELIIYSLDSQRILSRYVAPGNVFAVCCDPSIDYVLLGLQTGDVIAFDLDRGRLAPLHLPSFAREFDARARVAPVEALALHPRDIGTLLIGYAEGAAIYSFKQNKPLKFFRYEVPRGAPGGDGGGASGTHVVRRPRLLHAVWHPTGTFVLTGHEDGSLVFWDARDGRIVMARTLTDTNVDKPSTMVVPEAAGERDPLRKIVWCANQDPEDTAILISGGASSTAPARGLTLLELGRTPVYSTSSWQVLAQYLAQPKRQRMLPTPPETAVVDFVLLPRTSPYFAGAHDPIALIAVLGSGELITMSFPSGYTISPSNQLHVSASFVCPYIGAVNLEPVQRQHWLGMRERREKTPLLLTGGAETRRPSKSFEDRNVVQAAHVDGIIRLWDAGHGDDIENGHVIEVDIERVVSRPEGTVVTKMSFAGASGEFSVGTRAGEVVVFKWGVNQTFSIGNDRDKDAPRGPPGQLQDISAKVDQRLEEGLLPSTMVDMQSGEVTALKNSDVGFIAAGFQNGCIMVIDMRGPAIIYNANLKDLEQQQQHQQKSTFSRRANRAMSQADFATCIEFSVMTLDDDNYSSILLHVGTAAGVVATFKILPEQSGRYSVQYAGMTRVEESSSSSSSSNNRVIRICPIQADRGGAPAYATQPAVGGLRQNVKTAGALVAVTHSGCRVFRPAAAKGAAHKSWDSFVVQSAAVTHIEGKTGGRALVTLSDDGHVRAYGLPGLKELAPPLAFGEHLDSWRAKDAIVTGTGDVFGWKSPAEMSLLNIWGRGLDLTTTHDVLWNPQLSIPPRPTISNVEWLSGTQYITPVDLDILIGGPDRPPSKRMLAQLESDRMTAAKTPSLQNTNSGGAAGGQQQGYWEYMQRQLSERTEKLGTLGDNMTKLEEASASWADEAGKFVARQKRNLVMGAVKSKFGF